MMRALTDLLMPRCCLVCGRQLGVSELHLCTFCAADVPLTYYWEQAHNPMADSFNAVLERLRTSAVLPVSEDPMPYAFAAALLFYHHDNPYSRIPQALKYGGNRAVGRFFAVQLGRLMAAAPWFADVDCVIPVPLHWRRRWGRGYNQAEVIAACLADALGARLAPGALRRVRRTRTQTRLSAAGRFSNVLGVFRVRRRFQARHILLVDDTFTTGATLAACYLALREALGPGPRISVATLSVVQD